MQVQRPKLDRSVEPVLVGYSGYIRGKQHSVGKTYGETCMQGYTYHPVPAPSQDKDAIDRFQSMSLGTEGHAVVGNKAKVLPNTQTNRLDDIEGTKPCLPQYKFTNKPRLSTIDGNASKRLHPTNPNKVDRSLAIDDIDGTKPKVYTFQTQRQTNPLAPDDYKIPSYKAESLNANGIWEGKKITETNNLSDIQGTGPTPVFKYPQRFNSQVDDIEGTQVGWRPRNERARREGPPRDIIGVGDICTKGRLRDFASDDASVKRSKRMTNALVPEYTVNGMTLKDDPLTKSKALTFERDGGRAPTFSLYTDDIEGSKPGWVPGQPKRRQYGETNKTSDLPGAQSNRKFLTNNPTSGIRTQRIVDPVSGSGYIGLDGDPLVDSARTELDEGVGEAFRNATMGGHMPTLSRCAAVTPSAMTGVEKDAVIERLQQEISFLKQSRTFNKQQQQQQQQQQQPGPRAGMRSRGGKASSHGSSGSRGALRSAGVQSMQSRQSRPGTGASQGANNFVPPLAVPQSQMPVRLATPSQRRTASDLAESIASVRDL